MSFRSTHRQPLPPAQAAAGARARVAVIKRDDELSGSRVVARLMLGNGTRADDPGGRPLV